MRISPWILMAGGARRRSWSVLKVPGAWAVIDPTPDNCFTDDIGEVPASDGELVQLYEEPVAGRNFSQASMADRPVFLLEGSTNRYYLSFGGPSPSLNCGVDLPLAAADPVWMGCRVRVTGNSQTLLGIGGGSGSGQGRSLVTFNNHWYFFGAGTGDYDTGDAMVAGLDSVHVVRVTGGGSSIKWWVDGTEYTGSATLADTDATAKPRLGLSHVDIFPLSGRVYRAVIGTGVLSDADRNKIAAWL